MQITPEQKILVLAPHTDDAEFGCGGTISKLINQGNRVIQVAFSSAPITNIHGTRNEVLINEQKKASSILGMEPGNVHNHEFEVRNFDMNRQRILDLMIFYKNIFDPDIILAPNSNDIHQDHQVIYNECIRCFKHQTILGYELGWNVMQFNYDLFIHLSVLDIENKIRACMEYESQKHRPYSSPNYIRSQAVTNGVRINAQFAEAFECIRINLK